MDADNPSHCDPAPSLSALDDADDCCPVCSDPMEPPCRTACGHMFCCSCLIQSFKMKRPWNRGSCPLCRRAASLYSTFNTRTGEPLQLPEVTTVFGSVYVQNGVMGVAS